ncbi:TnsD family Tn7-like transposition protein [Heyndrickxia vini]|uniref:TnsD family transposase n=1 Tax=Heyndrickxia vini TaxID=1476025 RepID=A0ABX7E1L5_9BACI|nr:TnsD family Tn7-like transposition protein [Heyndrickxia vini]QQZ09609.1 TnsD family transposase [Heyndrickxia vini]
MLSFFPSLYKNELIYSVLARYHNHSGNLTINETTKDIFGKAKSYIIPDFTTDLEYLHKKIKYFLSIELEEMINKHTLFNYYTNFCSQKIKDSIKSKMIINNGSVNFYYLTGQMASTVKEPQYFRYCPFCLTEDIKLRGETYWRGYHQLPSVMLCLEHRAWLENSSVLFRQVDSSIISATEGICLNGISSQPLENKLTNSEIEILYRLGKTSYELLINDFRFDYDSFSRNYRFLLSIKGYITARGVVNQKKLETDFNDFYSKDILILMQSIINYDDENSWLRSITRKHRKVFHPVRHILVLNFLGISLNDFNNINDKTYTPFGKGPYLCLNAASDHYLKPVITDLKVSRCSRTKRPVGTFSCSCGFIYSRQGPDKTNEDKKKIGRIKAFGDVWLKKLHHLIHVEKISYRSCAKILNVDTNTVIKYSKINNLKSKEEINCSSLLQNNKNQWIKLREDNPNASRTELRKINPVLFARLYRRDKEWLNLNSPNQKVLKKTIERIDWEKRDKEILGKIYDIISDLKSRSKPIRLTLGSIGKELNILALLEKNKQKMPLTEEYIGNNLESVKDFQIRRIHWAIGQLQKHNVDPVKWKVGRIAGLNAKFYKIMENQIEECINKSSK